jgi:hypothetical protein
VGFGVCGREKLIVDRHGYSNHGDYVFGWKDDALQRAMDTKCNGDACAALKSQSPEEAMKCTVPRVVEEDIDGCKLTSLYTRAAKLLTDSIGLQDLPGDRMPF